MISVVIPAYNREDYIEACLDSIIRQSYGDLEIIVVNDGSTDSTGDICRRFASDDARIKVIDRPNGGLSRARNTGLDHATGDFIAFVDSDDMLHHDAVMTMAKIAGKSSCDIVAARYDYSETPHFEMPLTDEYRVIGSKKAIEMTLYQTHGMNNSVCGKLFRRRLFDKVRFTGGTMFEDLDIFYKLYDQTDRIALSNAPVYFYRANPTSFINTWSPARLDAIKVCDDMAEYIYNNIPSLKKAADDRCLSTAFNMLINTTRNNVEPSVSAKCRQTIKRLRLQSLLNPKVRLKNKIGIVMSYGGPKTIISLSRWLSKY